MSADALHIVVVLSPFLTLPVVGWLGASTGRARLLPLIPALLATYFTYAAFRREQRSLRRRRNVGTSPESVALVQVRRSEHVVRRPDHQRRDADRHLRARPISLIIPTRRGLTSRCSPSWARCSALVLSDNVIALFLFWELTGFTSYLLIGFEHERPEARRAATQALLVTGGGGLALLAAGLLLVQVGGTRGLVAARCQRLALR